MTQMSYWGRLSISDNDNCQFLIIFVTWKQNNTNVKKNRDSFPVTERDWLALIRNLPVGCSWVAWALVIGVLVKLIFFE